MKFSVIIPAFNEAANIGPLIGYLHAQLTAIPHEIIVADAESPDGTGELALAAGGLVVSCPEKSRARQMNRGAAAATGDVLYFLHADTFPPAGFGDIILKALERGTDCGCFRLGFDIDHWFLKANCYFTRFNIRYFRWGDQSLFIRREIFDETGGFRNELRVMEDQEYMIRLLKAYRFAVLPYRVTTSARKYLENGVIKLQLVFTLLQTMYHMDASQDRILRLYARLIRDKKVNAT